MLVCSYGRVDVISGSGKHYFVGYNGDTVERENLLVEEQLENYGILESRFVSMCTTYNFRKFYLDSNGDLWVRGDANEMRLDFPVQAQQPMKIPGISNVIFVATESARSLILDAFGFVWALGTEHEGNCGLGINSTIGSPTKVPKLKNIKAIATGSHSLALDSRGIVWTFGENREGQLGFDDMKPRSIPTMIPRLRKIIAIACGNYHSLLLDSLHGVQCFGDNSKGW